MCTFGIGVSVGEVYMRFSDERAMETILRQSSIERKKT